ncbi:Apolipoprotein C-IV [Camelus dromedarius]|uniref:Apolipoprotein C-IV n=1 Tax=Camelus dromedarius TaxID=9838 RepID=A0A5N4DQR3_CAMDR|nr:Apolipoprotein C-IV [Camelus dromedarius]
MSFSGHRSWAQHPLCFCILVLACVVGEEPVGGRAERAARSGSEGGIRRGRGGREEMVQTQNITGRQGGDGARVSGTEAERGLEAFQGFVQTYFEDHLKDLVSRTQAWLHSSKDSLLSKAHNLCPQLLCEKGDQD